MNRRPSERSSPMDDADDVNITTRIPPIDLDRPSFEPSNTDVLLGRGVGTNRHPGNENFRKIVAEHVGDYATCTKKEKIRISLAIVDRVKTELDPPGKFLEKHPLTGLWHEVDDRRAVEKAAQALRDGAAPLRKQMRKDMASHPFLLKGYNGGGAGGEKSLGERLGKPVSNRGKKLRRSIAAPLNVSDTALSSLSSNPCDEPGSKKARSVPDISSTTLGPDPFHADNFMNEMRNAVFATRQRERLTAQLPTTTLLQCLTQPSEVPSQNIEIQVASNATPQHDFLSSLARTFVSSMQNPGSGPSSVAQQGQEWGPGNGRKRPVGVGGGLSNSINKPVGPTEHAAARIGGLSNSISLPLAAADPLHMSLVGGGMGSVPQAPGEQSATLPAPPMPVARQLQPEKTPSSTSSDFRKSPPEGDISTPASSGKDEVQEEAEFAREMGPDEHFLELCDPSGPVGSDFSGDDLTVDGHGPWSGRVSS